MKTSTPARLGDLVDILSGFAFDSAGFGDTGDIPVIRIRDVVRGRSNTYFRGGFDQRFVIEDGALLVGMDGEFNRERWSGGRALLNQRVCRITATSATLDSGYLYHFLPRALKAIEDATPFVTVKHLSAKQIRDIEIPIPSPAQQRRIAEVLDRAETLRAQRRQALAQLDALAESIFLDMFGDPLMNPKVWPISKLSMLGTLDRGVSKHRPRNEPTLLGGTHPLIQTGDVANCDRYMRTFTATYSDAGLRQSRKWPAGTLCITIAANIAKTGILSFDACFPDSVVGFTPGELATIEYVQTWLSFLQKMLEDSAPESAQKNINLAILRDLDVPLPPIELQRSYSARLAMIEQMKATQRLASKQLDALFASLQHRAFRGEL